MSEWNQCVIVGCDCKRKSDTPPRGGWCGDEWICMGHWSMSNKKTRNLFIRVRRKLTAMAGDDTPGALDHRRFGRLYTYLWYRLKCQITSEAMGL